MLAHKIDIEPEVEVLEGRVSTSTSASKREMRGKKLGSWMMTDTDLKLKPK